MRFFWMMMLPASLAAQVTVIQNANVLTITKGSFKGSVVIENGKIMQAGEKVLIKLISFDGTKDPVGTIIEHLGRAGEHRAAVAVLHRRPVADLLAATAIGGEVGLAEAFGQGFGR